jgi:hypothetical protein
MVRGPNPGGGPDCPPVQTGPAAHPASCTMGTGSFPGVKCGRGMLLTTHLLLAPRSWKSRAIPLPPSGPQLGLQRVYFTFYHTIRKKVNALCFRITKLRCQFESVGDFCDLASACYGPNQNWFYTRGLYFWITRKTIPTESSVRVLMPWRLNQPTSIVTNFVTEKLSL